MADRSVRFDFFGRDVSASRTAKSVAREFDDAADKAEHSGIRSGRRFFKGFGDGVDKDHNRFQRILKKSVTPDPQLFESLKHTLAYTLSTPLGLGIAAALTTALAGTIPAAVAAGLGGGLIAIGAFALKGSKILKARFTGAGAAISEAMAKAAQPLQGPLLEAIGMVTGALVVMRHQFYGIFKGVAGSIKPLARGLIGMFQGIMDGVQAALPAIQVALSTVASRLPGFGKTLGGVLAAFSDNLPAIEHGIDLFFTLSEVVLNVAGAFATFGQKALESVRAVANFATLAVPWISRIGEMNSEAALNAATQAQMASISRKNAAKQEELAAKVKASRKAFYEQRTAIASVIPAFEGYSNKSTVTKGKILSNLREEVNAFKNWAANTRELLRRGADPAVVKALSEKGPQYVAAFVHASDRELRDLNRLFKSRTQAAGSVAVAASRSAGAAMGRAAAAGFSASFHPVFAVPRAGTSGGGKKPFKGQRPKAFASGGVISEPVAGIGLRSGSPYSIGERGPEMVTPMGRAGTGGGSVTVNVYAHPTSSPKEVGAEVYKALKAYMGSNSAASLA